jgi:hypothetical protein
MTLYEVPPELLLVPLVTYQDFEQVRRTSLAL